MKTLERGVRKKGRKLYQLISAKAINPLPFYLWRTEIGKEEMLSLNLDGFIVRFVPEEKWKLILGD